MKKINTANLKKTIYYLKRNGLKNTWYAVRERLDQKKGAPYIFTAVSEEEKGRQRKTGAAFETRFSLVVPAYRTDRRYLEELIASVSRQTYPRWELVIADATEDGSVEEAVGRIAEKQGLKCLAVTGAESADAGAGSTEKEGADASTGCMKRESSDQWHNACIRYLRLKENAGIAENTNRGLAAAGGEYIGLLDHDDLLTENALYEMAEAIAKGKQAGVELKLLYSDEDKCDGSAARFFEPNRKEDFNLDLLLSNNYICHFLVMETGLIKKLGFRQAYNGAQDYDLVLRAAEQLMDGEEQIAHVPLVLYHWRCHEGSTAENPRSKQYAYDAGRKALQDFADRMGWSASAVPLKHLGFYVLRYREDPLKIRPDLGAVGGRLVAGRERKTVGGRMTEEGQVFYQDLPFAYSGELHRAALTQDAEALDIRCIQIKEELYGLFENTTGVSYKKREHSDLFDPTVLPEGTDYIAISIKLSKAIRARGYRLLYLPDRAVTWNAGKSRTGR